MTRKALTAEKVAQLERLELGFRKVIIAQWEVQGWDVSAYVELFRKPGKPRIKRKIRPAVSTIGDRVKEQTKWTGIKECQRCTALRNKLNRRTVAQVREGIDGYAAELLANLVALAKGEAVDLSWWDRKTAQAKATLALKVMGEDSVLQRCKGLILAACDDEEREAPALQSEGHSTGCSSEPGPLVASVHPNPPGAAALSAPPQDTGSPPRREPAPALARKIDPYTSGPGPIGRTT